jgi:hypothetical protein
MKKLLLFVLTAGALASATLVLPHSSAQEDAATRERRAREEWVLKSLKEMSEVKVGMTRADLLKVFGEEGGLSTRTQRTYVYKECLYFKVNVKFEPVGEVYERHGVSPADKIVEISRPYIDYSVLD